MSRKIVFALFVSACIAVSVLVALFIFSHQSDFYEFNSISKNDHIIGVYNLMNYISKLSILNTDSLKDINLKSRKVEHSSSVPLDRFEIWTRNIPFSPENHNNSLYEFLRDRVDYFCATETNNTSHVKVNGQEKDVVCWDQLRLDLNCTTSVSHFSPPVSSSGQKVDSYPSMVPPKQGHFCWDMVMDVELAMLQGRMKTYHVEGFIPLAQMAQWLDVVADSRNNQVCEAGFNSGHSALMWLRLNPQAKLISFDVGLHDDVTSSAEYIHKRFPGRFELILGDSEVTVPSYIKNNPSFRCNVVHIDKGHSSPFQDLLNFYTATNRSWFHLLINNANIDTLNNYSLESDISKGYRQAIEEGFVVHEACFGTSSDREVLWNDKAEWCSGSYNMEGKDNRELLKKSSKSISIKNHSEMVGDSLLIYSFFAIHTSYAGYASDPTQFFKPFMKNRICYAKKHNLSFALQTVDWTKHQNSYAGITYMKPRLVKEIMRLNPRWLFFMDSDLVIVDFAKRLEQYLHSEINIIVNDHNAALNNGAFFLQSTPTTQRFLQIWDDITFGKRPPFIDQHWPFTDNGAFIEALVQIGMNEDVASRCGDQFKKTMDGGSFLNCYHQIYSELSGVTFNGVTDRVLPGGIMLSHSVKGFNNHKCNSEALHNWGWSEQACFHPDESMIMHSKVFELAASDSQACPAAEIFDVLPLNEGTLMFLPDSDAPCHLEEDSCQKRADRFFHHMIIEPV